MSLVRNAAVTVLDPGEVLIDAVGDAPHQSLAFSFAAVVAASVVGTGLGFSMLKYNEFRLLPGYTVETLLWFALLGSIVGLLWGIQVWVGTVLVVTAEAFAVSSVTNAGFESALGRLCYSLVAAPLAAAAIVVVLAGTYLLPDLGTYLLAVPLAYLVVSHLVPLLRLVFGGAGHAVRL